MSRPLASWDFGLKKDKKGRDVLYAKLQCGTNVLYSIEKTATDTLPKDIAANDIINFMADKGEEFQNKVAELYGK